METELISRETITPSTPTPPHLKIYPLSFIDHIICRNYIPSLFFYQPNEEGQECDQKTKICELKKSLSQVLSKYYPFAGRFRDQLSIECKDQGVLFLVTRITGTKLSAILQNPTETLLNPLFPDGLQWEDVMSPNGSIVAVQINCFECGGMAISVCMSHKVGDGSTLYNFVNDWATMNREKEKGELLLPDSFLDGGVSVFPHGDLPVFPEIMFPRVKTVVCRRFLFPASKIKSLKDMVSSHGVQNPTRVQVVIAWIHKCAVSAMGLTLNMAWLSIFVNLRRKMVPPLPDKCVGNMIRPFMFNLAVDKNERELPKLVSKIKEELCKFYDVYPNKFGGIGKDLSFISECLKQASLVPRPLERYFSTPEPCGSDHKKKEMLFTYTSLCGFPLYDTDFGWGKPIWVTQSGAPMMNFVILMDTQDGDGIEVLVNMDEKDMAKFECNAELLQFASLNPKRWSSLSVTQSSVLNCSLHPHHLMRPQYCGRVTHRNRIVPQFLCERNSRIMKTPFSHRITRFAPQQNKFTTTTFTSHVGSILCLCFCSSKLRNVVRPFISLRSVPSIRFYESKP